MAGTDFSKQRAAEGITEGGPAVILVYPQLGENIGMVARSMLNCGLGDLRLVAPRDGWPNDRANAAASGALVVLERARVFETTAEAIADLDRVYATTARSRDMVKPVMTPKRAAEDMRQEVATGGRVGVLFGREAKGLHNDDVSLADTIIEAPLNPGFSSLNLAQAVLLVAYEWYQLGVEREDLFVPVSGTRPATKEELVGFFEHLESELDACGFLYPPEKRPAMVRNIRNMFQRATLTEQEIRTLRGIVAGLAHPRHLRPKR